MVLRNIIELQDGVPAVLHVTDWAVQAITHTDPLLGREKRSNRLVLMVDRCNGAACSATFSTLSEKLASALMPILQQPNLKELELVITARGEGFTRSFTVGARPFRVGS